MRSALGRLRRSGSRSLIEQLATLTSVGDGSTLTLDFTTGVLDPRLTFTRGSTGTRINSSGFVETMSNNVARFDYDPATLAPRGLLIEGQAVNLLCWSESFATSGGTTNWTYNGNSGATVTETNPAGGSSSFQFRETSGSGPLSQTVTTVSTSPYTFSFWVRASVFNSVTTTQIQVGIFTTAFQTVSISKISGPGSVSGTGLCTVSGLSLTEWTKVQVTTTGNIGATSASVMLYAQTASFELDRSLLIWGAMLEQGSGASSYIPTGASQGTRNRDELTLTNLSSIAFSQTSGTAFAHVEVREKATGNFPPYGSFDTSGGGRCWWWLRHNRDASLGTRLLGNVFNSGGSTVITTSNYQYNSGNGGLVKFATSLDTAASALVYVIGGGSPQTTTASAFTLATAARWSVNVNNDVAATDLGSMWMRSFKYWPTNLPNATLQSLTT